MYIKMINKNEIEDIKLASKLIWKEYQKRMSIYMSLLFICSIVIIYFGLISDYDYQTYTNESGNYQINQYNYNLITGFGFSILFYLLIMVIVFFKQKTKFEIDKKHKIKNASNYTERILCDDFIEFKSDQISRKTNWNVFEAYKVLDNYIFFNQYKKSNIHLEYLNLDKLSLAQQEELFKTIFQNKILKE